MIYRLPPLNALRVFEAAARHLSFKEAAAELNITQAAVSHQVKSLEDYLGVDLFRRAGRGVQLTEAARACLPRLREGFDSLAAAVEMIRERGDEAELVITAPPVFTARWLMPRLADFAKREPKIDVRVVATSKMVDAGALDSPVLIGNLDLRSDASGVEIHLGAGRVSRPPRRPPVRRDDGGGGEPGADRRRAAAARARRPRAPRAAARRRDGDRRRTATPGRSGSRRADVADRVDGSRGPRFSSNILSLEAASQKLGVALALRPLIDADVASGRLVRAVRDRGQAALGLLPGLPRGHRRAAGGAGVPRPGS